MCVCVDRENSVKFNYGQTKPGSAKAKELIHRKFGIKVAKLEI